MDLTFDQQQLLGEFEAAVEAGDLRAHYQMLVSAHGRSVRGVEALVRWEHPQRGMLAPGLFLPMVESSPHIGALTEWVLDEALRQCALWRAAGWVVPVSVNLSVTLVSDETLPQRVGRALARHGLPGHLLTLEVTESAIMSRGAAVADILADIRRTGARLSVDDFGTGYTSLAMLKNFRFDELKIDRSFISGVRTDQNDSAIVRSVLSLGHLLGLDVVAEGVEDADTANWLAEIGCDVLQGFHFAKPVPPSNLEAAFTNSGQLGEGRVRYMSEQSSPAPVAVTTQPGIARDEPGLTVLEPDSSLGAGADVELDELVKLACAALGVPSAVVSTVIRARRHWAQASHGLDVDRLPAQDDFWPHAIASDDVMEVPDARYDERFATAGLVVGYPFARFYASVPLIGAEGRTVGALSVLDTKPHTLTDTQRDLLRGLAQMALRQLEARRGELLQQRVMTRVEQLTRLHRVTDMTTAADMVVEVAQRILHANGACLLLGEVPGSVTLRVAGAGPATAQTVEDLAQVVVDSRDDHAINQAVRTREPVFVADVASSEMVGPQLGRLFDMASALYLPVVSGDAVLGTVVAWWAQPQASVPLYAANLAVLLASEAGMTLSRLRAVADLRAAAETDTLTGLSNRRSFIRGLHMLPPGSALVMMDLDNFRAVNEQRGHLAGDQVLKSFAAHLRAVLRSDDVAARWGGEEFAVALPNCDLEGAARVVQRLRQSWVPSGRGAGLVPDLSAAGNAGLAPTGLAHTGLAPTTFSAGLVALREQETPEQALDRADAALASAKSQGCNRDSVHV